MDRKTKQNIIGIVLPLLSIPPLYFTFLHNQSETDWLLVFLSILPLIIAMGAVRIAWGPAAFRKLIVEEDGYSNFKDWFRTSGTFIAKFTRYSLIVFVLFIVIYSIIKQ